MSWTYSGDPGSSDRDELRFKIQDVDTDCQLFSDEELDYILNKTGSVCAAALDAVTTLLSRFAGYCDEAVGQVKITYSQKYEQYRLLKQELESDLAISGGGIYAGGISISDKELTVQDTDRVEPEFTKDIFECPNGIKEQQNPNVR